MFDKTVPLEFRLATKTVIFGLISSLDIELERLLLFSTVLLREFIFWFNSFLILFASEAEFEKLIFFISSFAVSFASSRICLASDFAEAI